MRNCKPRKWTDKKRWEAASQCSSLTEYCERFNGAYEYDRKRGLLGRYNFERKIPEGRDPNAEDYVIYVYRDFEKKVAYVGLTFDERKEKRHREHLYGRRDKDGSMTYDVVAKYWHSIGKPLPRPTYVMEGLHIDDVGYYENWYRRRYEEAGWNVLNIAECGSLGGAKVKWTYETCLEDSKNYDTRASWKKGNSTAYYKAVRNYTEDGRRWIDTFEWRDSHEVRSEASRKRQTGKTMNEERRKRHSELLKKHYAEHPKKKGNKLSEEHKKHIGESLKKFYTKAA